jgi:Tfp pilus assembly protein PilO
MARTWTKSEKRLAVVVLAALIGFIALRGAIMPLASQWRFLAERESALESQCLRARTQLLLKKKVEHEREAYAREISRQGSDQEEQSFLLQEVERLSRDLPIRIRGMRPLPPQEMGFYRRYAVTLELEGSVENVLKFLCSVESSPKLLKVERVQLTADSRNRGNLTASMFVSRPAVGGAEGSTAKVQKPAKPADEFPKGT